MFLAILPLGHNYNLACPGMLGVFHAGGTLVIAKGTDAAEVFTTIARERVTTVAAVVPLITTWLNGDLAKQFDVSSLQVVQNGGARLAPELRARLRSEFGCTPQEIYGTAEGLINMTRLTDTDDLLLESSGAPVSDWDEIAVLDDQERVVPDGEPGELVTQRALHHSRLLQRSRHQCPGVYRGRLLSDGRHRQEAGPLRLHRRAPEGPHQSRRREDQLRRSREPDLQAPVKSGR